MKPEIVYKYRDWKNSLHKRILINNEVYLSSPKDFNDPFDCRITENYNLFTPEEEETYINELLVSGFPKTEAQGLDGSVPISVSGVAGLHRSFTS